jgi:cholesterol transport system auxiliary component
VHDVSQRTPILWNGVVTHGAFNESNIAYRLLFVQGGQQSQPYSLARWIQPPPQMVEHRLRAVLAATRPVVDASTGLAGSQLQIELDEFSQEFDSPEQSFGVVRMRATLLERDSPETAKRVRQRSFIARVEAPTPNAAGGAQALRTGADQVIDQIVEWVNTGK